MASSFEIAVASDGRFHFRLKATNGQVILSSQMYASKSGAEGGIASVKTNAGDDANYERKEDSSGRPYFVLKAANTQVIGTSQMYSGKAEMENGIASVQKNAPDADIVDLSAAT